MPASHGVLMRMADHVADSVDAVIMKRRIDRQIQGALGNPIRAWQGPLIPNMAVHLLAVDRRPEVALGFDVFPMEDAA